MVYKADRQQQPSRRSARQSSARKRSGRSRYPVFVLAGALAAAALLAALALTHGSKPGEPGGLEALPATGEEEYTDAYAGPVYSEDTFMYNNETFRAYESVRRNEYDPAGFTYKKGSLSYTDPVTGHSALRGVDVSAHQDEIDWSRVKADGIDFAMIRVGYRGNTEGKLNLDNQYLNNISGASAAGVPVGIYFFSQAVDVYEARAEARWVLEQIEGYEITYPVVFDWEYSGSDTRTAQTGGRTIDECCEEFCRIISAAGYKPMIYFNRELALRTIDLYRLRQYDFWLAEYNEAPTFYYGFEMLQYSYTGTVDGIDGEVDLDLCFKNYA